MEPSHNRRDDVPDVPEVEASGLMDESGAAGWALLWLIGVPIPVLLALFVLRGCT